MYQVRETSCSYVSAIWFWIAHYNNFIYAYRTLQDLWFIDTSIPFKDQLLMELVKGAVIWSIWLKRNKIIFKDANLLPFQTIGTKILSMTFFGASSSLILIF